MATSQPGQYISKDQKKHQKSLEAARQAGTIPAEKDEEGNDINPHMPKFIINAPWYVDDSQKPSLKHQKWFKQEEKVSMDKWYARGQRGHQATSYRKGACTNCGAMTHQAKDCCERPRKKGAKQTGQDIKADEIIVEDIKFNYDSKRDRYNGYDPSEYMKVMEEHDKYEAMRKIQKEEQKKLKKQQKKQLKEEAAKKLQKENEEKKDKVEGEQPVTEENEIAEKKVTFAESVVGGEEQDNKKQEISSDDDSDSEEEDKESALKKVDYGVSFTDDTKTYRRLYNVVKMEQSSFRQQNQLRIREDRAVYLENLDENSAFYDPKSRTMRENPNPHLPEDQQNYKGLNYVRHTGDAAKVLDQEVFVWDRVQNQSSTIGSVAVPSATEKFFKAQKQEDIDRKNQKIQELNEKYGGAEHFKSQKEISEIVKKDDEEEDELEKLEREKQYELNQKFKNVSAAGINNTSAMKLSKYPEDNYQLGHTAIWGSYWNDTLGWGYACCYGTDKMTQCEGIKARGLVAIREYHFKKAAEEKLKKFEEEQQKQLKMIEEEEEENNEESSQEQNNQKEKKNNEELDLSDNEKSDDQKITEKNSDKKIIKKTSKSGSGSSSDSSDDSSSSDSSDSDSSDSESSDSNSSSSSSSSDSESEDKKKKSKKDKKQNKVQKKADKKIKEKKKHFKKLDSKQVEEVLKKQQEKINNKKRKYNSLQDYKEPTEEDIENYHKNKKHGDDPMAKFNDVD